MKFEKSICIIDDDKIYQMLTKKMLVKLNTNYPIHQFYNGLNALNFLKESMANGSVLPSIILLDINMPVMDGWEFLKAVEELLPRPRNLQIFLVTSSIAAIDMDKAKNSKLVTKYIPKPIRPEILQQIIL